MMPVQEVSRALKVSTVAGFIGMWWFAVAFGVPTTMLIESLSSSGVLIGLIVTLQQLALFIQIPSALFFEGLPRRKNLWAILAVIHRILWFTPAIVPLIFHDSESIAITLLFTSITISAVIAQFCGPIWQNWMADLIPRSISGKYWGYRQSIVTVSFLLSTYVAGCILDYFPEPRKPGGSYMGFTIVFTYAAILGICDILVHMLVPEPAHGLNIRHKNIIKRIMEPLENSDFRWMTFAFAIWFLGVGLTGSFALVYLKRDFNVTYTHLAYLAMCSTLGPVLFGILSGYLIDKIGARIFAAILFGIIPFLSVAWFFVENTIVSFPMPFYGLITLPQPVAIFMIINFASGTLFGALGISQIHMLNILSPRDGRGMAIAVHWSIVGIMAASGPLLGGMIMDYFIKFPMTVKLVTGEPFSYFQVLIIIFSALSLFVCLPLILKVKVKAGDMELREVFQSVKVGNPLRAVTTVLNIYQTAFDLNPPKENKK